MPLRGAAERPASAWPRPICSGSSCELGTIVACVVAWRAPRHPHADVLCLPQEPCLTVEKQRTLRPYGRSHTKKWLAFLARASDLLAVSLDYQTTLASVVQLAVPSLADLCFVDVFDADGTLQRVAVACTDHEHEEQLRALQRPLPAPPPGHPLSEALQTRRPLLMAEPSADQIEQHIPATTHRALGLRSLMILPLIARENTVGAITLATAAKRPQFQAGDRLIAMDLAHRCALAIDNARLYQQAHQALQTRAELFDLIAHDLKNPLTVIAGNVQLLQRRLAQPAGLDDRDMATRRLEQIAASAIQMRTMINDLLDLAHVRENQPIELTLEPTDLVSVARRMAGEYQQTSSRHTLAVETPLEELVGMFDRSRIERLIANLLSNAIKYSPKGGPVVVRVTRAEEADGSWAQIEVQDCGIGIPADDLPHIFERFRRAGNTSGHIGGTGVGLASVGTIAAQHGGTVSAESVEGQGSTFTVRLPLR